MSGGTSFLVDMKKVNLDVMKPWIAQRVTELLKSEDEDIVNYICGLLDGKEVDSETIQKSIGLRLRGKSGTFMQELWTHLVSAQENANGIPQQFLDAKEEGARKMQEDTDRITRELKDVTDEKNGSKETVRLSISKHSCRSKSFSSSLSTRSSAFVRDQFPSPERSDSPPYVKPTFESPGNYIEPFTHRSPSPTSCCRTNPPRLPLPPRYPSIRRSPSPHHRSNRRSTLSSQHRSSSTRRSPSPQPRSNRRRSLSPLHRSSSRRRSPSPQPRSNRRRSLSPPHRSSSRRRSLSPLHKSSNRRRKVRGDRVPLEEGLSTREQREEKTQSGKEKRDPKAARGTEKR